MTSLTNLIIMFAVAGAVLTALTMRAKKANHPVWTFLQHFTGVWFIVSGIVKAIDPIGTGYKMEDYFGAFEQTFAGLNNFFSGLAPLFPALAKSADGFSIFMIVLEIALGVMLILGFQRKITAWLFFLIVFFFTILTGFTYLTGFVPTDANFFDFAKWGPYVKEQMRVTDCGCFGDFIKLNPKVSFYKDLFLMVPALLFLFRWKKMHQILDGRKRRIITWAGTAASLLFCFQNTYLDLPVVDFRPFKIGTDVRAQREFETSAKMDILGWVLEDTVNHVKIKYMEPEPGKITYYKEYPKTKGWLVREQIKSDWYVEKDGQKLPVTKTKISEMAVEDLNNSEVTDDLLAETGYSLMIVAYKIPGDRQEETVTRQDTVWAFDTLRVGTDSMSIQRRVASVETRQFTRHIIIPDPAYADLWQKEIAPLAEGAEKAGWKVYTITTYADKNYAADFAKKTGVKMPFYIADDKFLKTIIRAQPGIVVWKDGKVLDMYHHRHIPDFDRLGAKWKS